MKHVFDLYRFVTVTLIFQPQLLLLVCVVTSGRLYKVDEMLLLLRFCE